MTNGETLQKYPPGPDNPVDLNYTSDILDKIMVLWYKYGNIFKTYSPSRKSFTYVVTDPEFVKHVLSTSNKNFLKGVGNEIVKMLLGNGIIVSQGDHWKRQRRMIQPAFHKDVIKAMSEKMSLTNIRLTEKWHDLVKRGQPINITSEMSGLALDIILECLFSTDIHRLIREKGLNPFDIVKDETVRDLQFARRFRNLTGEVTRMVESRNAERRIEMDFLSMFMEATDKLTGQKMTLREILDEVMTLIVAAHETTAGTLNWAWYHISKDRAIEENLVSEVDALNHDIPAFDDLSNLPFTLNVIQEALRLYPPVWIITRRAIQEDQLGPYYVPPRTDIFLCPFLTHRDPAIWSDPLSFIPERFEEEDLNSRHRFSFYPFSGGPRRCVGDFFAIVEMQIHLATMIRRFSLRMIQDDEPELEPQINLRSRHPIYLLPESR